MVIIKIALKDATLLYISSYIVAFFSIRSKSLTFDTVLKKHLSIAGISRNGRSSRAFAIYDLTGNRPICKDGSQDFDVTTTSLRNDVNYSLMASTLEVCFTWDGPCRLFESPPATTGSLNGMFNNGASLLRTRIVPGDPKMPCHQMYLELELLKGLASGLLGKEIVWQGSNKMETQANKQELNEKLVSLLEACKQHGPRSIVKGMKTSEVELSEDTDVSFGNTEVACRGDIDFTDMLWSTLATKLSSYSELCKSLLQVLETIQQEEIRPYIYQKNTTKVAELIHGMARDVVGANENIATILQCLNDGCYEIGNENEASQIPLQIFVEMGLEKLQRDHIHALLASSLAEREDLQPYTISSNLTYGSKTNLAQCLERLYKLQYIQEFVALCQTYLPSKKDLHCAIVKQALHQLRDKCIKESFLEFELNIKADHVKDQLRKMSPSVWNCTFQNDFEKEKSGANVGLLGVITTWNFSLEKPYEFVPLSLDDAAAVVSGRKLRSLSSDTTECNDEEGMTDQTEEMPYYCVMSTSIKRSLPGFG